jgi:hypothetical protein
MAKNKDERQIIVDIILHRKLNTKKHEHHKKMEWTQLLQKEN